jgi:hypothetical protein
MRKPTNYILIFILMLACFSPHTALANPNAEKAAISASLTWLALVDAGRYNESWQEAARFFKAAVTNQQWRVSMAAYRKPLGRLITRTLKSKTYATSLPGAPDGEYVVIQYATTFENKKSAIETITPMLDGDGRWRVSGYFIK